MKEDKELELFWAEKHRTRDKMYLSGNGHVTLDRLCVRSIFFTVCTLLNIGVGLGEFERFARSHVKRLDCVDITTAAITAISGVADHFYTEVKFAPANTYDLVTELLVAQHISDETLQEHLTWEIRALKDDGIFALQVADFLHSPSPSILAKNYTLASKKAGSVKRTVDTMHQIIEASGGAVIGCIRGREYPMYDSVWVIYRVKRAI